MLKLSFFSSRRRHTSCSLVTGVQTCALPISDPDSNPSLRMAWDTGTAANMPKENIQRAVQRGAGGADGTNYEEVRYEGYGVGGAAVIIDCMTDNRIRTVAEVRHALSKNGGNLGQEGSVAFMFKHCGDRKSTRLNSSH